MTIPNKVVDGVEMPLSDEELAEWQALQLDAPNVQWYAVRQERNALLAASDWTQLSDARVDALPWAVYRQALRDITTQEDPFNIAWPQEPE
jgi:hypothetical protein